jgi:hypothetical protein
MTAAIIASKWQVASVVISATPLQVSLRLELASGSVRLSRWSVLPKPDVIICIGRIFQSSLRTSVGLALVGDVNSWFMSV